MKILVKTLKGARFEVEAKPEDTVADVKRTIESVQGADVYPAAQQMLIHQGKVLNDGTTLEENKVAENTFIVVMLAKNKSSSGEASTASTAPPAKAAQSSMPPGIGHPPSIQAPVSPLSESGTYGQAASNLVDGSNMDGTVQQILDMGGGTWDRPTVLRALRAAYNNPERAIEYLYSGIPDRAEVPPSAQATDATGQPAHPTEPARASTGPNANSLNLFPQGFPSMGGSGTGVTGTAGASTLDFLQSNPQFQALRTMVQANPQVLQPMLQELGKQNPQLMRLIQDHQTDFLRLMNEPVEGGEGDVLGQLAESMSQQIPVTPEEREAIDRLEAMGFDRATVIQIFISCDKNEELAANYLLDHMHEFED